MFTGAASVCVVPDVVLEDCVRTPFATAHVPLPVAVQFAIDVRVVETFEQRDLIARGCGPRITGVAHAVAVAVRIGRAREMRAVIACVTVLIGVVIALVGIRDRGAVVAGVGDRVVVGIDRRRRWTVRCRIDGDGHGVDRGVLIAGASSLRAAVRIVPRGRAVAEAATGHGRDYQRPSPYHPGTVARCAAQRDDVGVLT